VRLGRKRVVGKDFASYSNRFPDLRYAQLVSVFVLYCSVLSPPVIQSLLYNSQELLPYSCNNLRRQSIAKIFLHWRSLSSSSFLSSNSLCTFSRGCSHWYSISGCSLLPPSLGNLLPIWSNLNSLRVSSWVNLICLGSALEIKLCFAPYISWQVLHIHGHIFELPVEAFSKWVAQLKALFVETLWNGVFKD
jgi:hypothetical protein